MAENALAKLRGRQETLFIAPQNMVEFWSVATRPATENGLGMSPSKAAIEITALARLFHLLPYRAEVSDAWRRIVLAQGVSGKQAHGAHIVTMLEVHSIASILTFNDGHFRRYPGITVINPAQL